MIARNAMWGLMVVLSGFCIYIDQTVAGAIYLTGSALIIVIDSAVKDLR